jgi:hypothetical protein
MKGFWFNAVSVVLVGLFLMVIVSSALAELEGPVPGPLCGNAALCDSGCTKFGVPPAGPNGAACTGPAPLCINSTKDCALGCSCIKRGSTLCQCDN